MAVVHAVGGGGGYIFGTTKLEVLWDPFITSNNHCYLPQWGCAMADPHNLILFNCYISDFDLILLYWIISLVKVTCVNKTFLDYAL